MDLKFVTPETFVIQTLILLFVLYVLNRYIVQPYIRYLDDIEDKQQKLESDYKHIDTLIKQAEEQKEHMLHEARQNAHEIQAQGETSAKAKKAALIQAAEIEAEQILQSARQSAKQEQQSLLSSVRSQLVDLVLRLNKKVFGEEKVSREYIEKELTKL